VQNLIGLKSFVLIQIRDILEVLILLGLVGMLPGSADSKELRIAAAKKARCGALGGDRFGSSPVRNPS
jgi:hypothetical protein